MSTAEPVSVLYVDDDPELGALVKLHLERDLTPGSYEVTTETDPHAALDRLRGGEAVDCVISDYDMPRMDGIEFREALRSSHPDLPFLLFSGTETDQIAAEIVRAGLSDYLRKDLDSDPYAMLVRRVDHAVRSGGQFDPDSDTTLDGVGVVGSDERFEEVDDTYASCYEYDAAEIEGKHWTDLHPATEVEHIRANVLPVVRNGGQWSGHSEGLRADGSTFTESKLVAPLSEGRLLIAVSELGE